MKSKSLFTKLVAFMLCVIMAISCLPVSAFAAENDWEGDIDVVETEPEPGSEASPIDLTNDLLYEGDLVATVTVPAGKTYYYIAYRVGGMIMQINGGEGVVCTTDGMMYPYAWTITNDSAEDATYVITVAYPEGTMDNPADAVLGDNYASVEANSQGYYFNYVAEQDGELAITVSTADGNWFYVVNNLTTYTYGDSQWSDSDPVVNPTVISVTAGDEIQISVNTYNPADMWATPAGDITVNLAYEPEGPEVDENLKFRQIGLSFAEIIGVEPLVMNSVVKNYDSYYIQAIVDTPDGPVETIFNVEDANISNSSYNAYRLEMLPKTMTDKITFVIFAEKDGVTFCSAPVVTSITELAIEKIAANEATDEPACQVLANMIQYGAEAQKAFTYRTDDLATDYLGDYAKFCTDINDSTLVPTANIVVEGSGIKVYANSLSLGSTVTVEFLFKQSAVPAGSEMRFVMNGETYVIPVEEFDAEFMSGYYLVQFSLKPRNFRDAITMAMYDADGNAISAVYTASVADYAANVVAKYPTLVPAMLAYGDSVLIRFPG